MDLLYITWLQNSGKLFSATRAHPCGVPARAQGFECRVEGLGFKNQGFGRPKLDSRDAMNMGSCQNYGPFLGTLNIRCRIIIRTQKGTIILTTTHMPGPL